jgi:hypothetical protein
MIRVTIREIEQDFITVSIDLTGEPLRLPREMFIDDPPDLGMVYDLSVTRSNGYYQRY